ncbi:MAG: hypothetical protein GY804_00200 [Alphaproteobacteria bacterium]|nr:hypothetical protein [Alphaproteobacteria bacterium]
MKSTKAELTQRINAALLLIRKYSSTSEAADMMMKQYSISKRQAYRYVEQASKIGKQVAIPDPKIAFTVKLSQKLVQRLREHAKHTEKKLSTIVTQSLEDFLQNGQEPGRKKQKRSRN